MPQVFAVQFDIVWEDKAANHAIVERMIEQAAVPRGSLIVLPEMFDVGFSLNTKVTAEQVTGGASEKWCAAAAKKWGAFVQGASVQRPDPRGKATNDAVVFNPDGELVCRYSKIFPFSGGREPEEFRGGGEIVTFDWHGIKVCPLICYDLRFPEIWRLAAIERAAEMFTIGASWPSPRQHHWLTLLSARAIENQAYVVGLNRCGKDPYLPYAGGSRIIDPKGEVMAQAGDGPMVISAEIDHTAVQSWRASFKALADVRREFLGRC
ncbi:MAG: hypothetical protein IT430_00695 [Phycisphaerales bacterium]|nr:hypothetical protein [Phycisphaerales bacterium]